MKALRWHGRKDLRYEDVTEPSAGPGEVKVKVNLAGICGSDLKEYSTGPNIVAKDKLPLTIGHEFAGTVAEVGAGVTGFKVGDRVTGLGYWVCGECWYCKRSRYNLCLNQSFIGINTDGCMAEYLIAPHYSLYHLPDTVSDEAGALVEPLAVAIHAVRQGKIGLGDSVAIVGDGTIGLCTLLAARAAGATGVYVIAKHRSRGKLAMEMGATAVLYIDEGNLVERITGLTGGLGADVSIECVGQPETPQLAVDSIRNGGTAVIVGVFEGPCLFNFGSVLFGEKTVVGSPIYTDEARPAIAMLADGRINPTPIITGRIPLKDAVAMGFNELLGNKEKNLKILLRVP